MARRRACKQISHANILSSVVAGRPDIDSLSFFFLVFFLAYLRYEMVLFEGWCLCISLAEHIKPLQTINSNISLRHLSHDSLLWPFFGGPLQRGTWLFYFEGDFEVDVLEPANLLIHTELNPLNGAVPHWSNFTDNNWGNLVKTFSDFHSHSQAQFCTFTADLLVPDSSSCSWDADPRPSGSWAHIYHGHVGPMIGCWGQSALQQAWQKRKKEQLWPEVNFLLLEVETFLMCPTSFDLKQPGSLGSRAA